MGVSKNRGCFFIPPNHEFFSRGLEAWFSPSILGAHPYKSLSVLLSSPFGTPPQETNILKLTIWGPGSNLETTNVRFQHVSFWRFTSPKTNITCPLKSGHLSHFIIRKGSSSNHMLHPWTLTWHWKISIFNRVHTSSTGCFSIVKWLFLSTTCLFVLGSKCLAISRSRQHFLWHLPDWESMPHSGRTGCLYSWKKMARKYCGEKNVIENYTTFVTREDVTLLMAEIRRFHQLRLVVYPFFYRVLYILGGCLGFLPSTVSHSKSSCCFGVFKGSKLAKQKNGKCTIDPPWIQIFWLLNAPLINITKTGCLVKKTPSFWSLKRGEVEKAPPPPLPQKGDMHRKQKTILGCPAGTGCKWIISPLFNK